MIEDLNVWGKTIKLSGENRSLFDTGLGNGFLAMTSEAQTTKKIESHQNF